MEVRRFCRFVMRSLKECLAYVRIGYNLEGSLDLVVLEFCYLFGFYRLEFLSIGFLL